MKRIGSQVLATMEGAGMVYVMPLGNGEHVLAHSDKGVEPGKQEVWAVNKHHAGYTIKWRNTGLEFCRDF